MGQFFDSVSQAFARNREVGAPRFWVGLGLLACGALIWWLWASRKATAEKRASLRAASALSNDDFEALESLAALGRVPVEEALVSTAAFERVTASGLASGADADVIHRLRELLHFDRLPRWAPLLSSRELPVAATVQVEGAVASIVELDERSFTVSLPSQTPPRTPSLELTVVHGSEARYRLSCRVLESNRVDGRWQLRLAHDEAPQRFQLRSYARVAGRSEAIEVTPMWPTKSPVVGTLVDVSAGGALVRAPMPFSIGELVETAFKLGSHDFAHLGAVVVGSSASRRRGSFEVQLEFSGVDGALRDRLVGSVNALASRH